MNKLRSQYLYQLIGQIQGKNSRTSQKPPYQGQVFYQLQFLCENFPNITKIFVFDDKLANPAIWKAIEQDQCFHSRYLLKCRNYQGYFYLVDWKELAGSFDKGSAKELPNNGFSSKLNPKNHEKN